MKEVFVIERELAPGIWEVVGEEAYSTEKRAIDICLSMTDTMKKYNKKFIGKVKKLKINY